MAVAVPLINGVRHSWSSVEIKIAGQIYVGVKEIKYSDKKDRAKIRGTRRLPIARTMGEYDAEGSVTLYLEEAKELRAALAAAGEALGLGFMDVPFDITVSYSDPGVSTVTDTLEGCVIGGNEGGGAEGPDALTSPIPLDIMLIRWNGLAPVLEKQ
jgi:hypothetical protein